MPEQPYSVLKTKQATLRRSSSNIEKKPVTFLKRSEKSQRNKESLNKRSIFEKKLNNIKLKLKGGARKR